MSKREAPDKITVSQLTAKKAEGRKISMLTAYDYPIGLLQDQAGVDIVFVGDSVGVNVLGYRSAQEVTMADMLHHAGAVRRAVQRAFFLVDMPFMSYQPSVETALLNAGRLVQESGAEGVKLEGGQRILPQLEAIVRAGIPTMGHLGFTPQSKTPEHFLFSKERGTIPKFHGKGPRGAQEILDQARLLEDAGAFGLVLEQVTEETAQAVTERLAIPVIGIGSGRYCDGQVLVVNDLIGLNREVPILAKAYASLHQDLADIFRTYCREVEEGLFPSAANALQMDEDKLRQLQQHLNKDEEG